MFKKLLVTVSALSLGLVSVGSVSAQDSTEDSTVDSTVSVIFTKDQTPVRIDSASDFNFEADHQIEGFSQEASEDISVVVTDNRGAGDGTGWKLTAKLGNFTDGTGNPSLSGAEIQLKSGTIEGNALGDPEVHGVNGTITLNSDAADIATADRRDSTATTPSTIGYGTWTITWEETKTLLDVPPGVSTPESHRATVTWTLSDTPI